MTATTYIQVRGLTHIYGRPPRDLVAVDSIDLDVARGEFVSVIGPSGCGKTTLLKCIGGLLTPTAGHLAIGDLGPAEAQRLKSIGFVFQDPSLLPWRTVWENLLLPLQLNPGSNSADHAQRSLALLQTVGLEGFRDYHPQQLSGGMKQRAALARALVFDPDVLLMDEPLGALDELTRASTRYEVLSILGRSGVPTPNTQHPAPAQTALMVTHSIAEAVIMSDRVVVLSPRPGRVIGQVDIGLPRPRDDSLEHSVRFLELVRGVKDLLASGVQYASPYAQQR